MIDETLYRKQMLQFLRMIFYLQTTVVAMGETLRQTVGDSFEQLVYVEREKLRPMNEKMMAQFEAADAAEWTAMLQQLNTPPH